MIEIILVAALVAVCAFYWLGKIAPSVTRGLWKGTASGLAVVRAPAVLQKAAAGRANMGRGGGCGGCKGCGKGGGCH